MLETHLFCIISLGEKQELILSVRDSAHLYRAGPSVVFLRLPQGSAIITTESRSGKYASSLGPGIITERKK